MQPFSFDYLLRRRRIKLSLYLFLFLVLLPSAGYPQGVVGAFLPIGALPSPPPWGWSTGFITTPLTTGRFPSQRFDPALPKSFPFTPTLPTCPTVAEHFWDIKRTSPEGNFNVADFPSFAISFATAPAALANCPPFPGAISILCMAVPKGILVEVDYSFCSIKRNPFPNCTSFFQSIRLSGCR